MNKVNLILVISILLAGCSGSQSSIPVVADNEAPDTTLARPADAQSAVLTDLLGTVEVRTGDSQWSLAQVGQTLKSGQDIRTGALSNVSLEFFDGSRAYLGSEAEIAVDVLDASGSGTRIVQLTQISGESQHDVAVSNNPGSHYDVITPAGSGTATGTKFKVMVLPDQLSQFWVEQGTVTIANNDTSVLLVAGQTTIISIGQSPIEPAFRITGEGKVNQIMTVGGEGNNFPAPAPVAQTNQKGKITLCHATGSATTPFVEITVSDNGASNGHTKHPGDIIPAPADGCPKAAPITSSTTTSWIIAGQTFQTGASTVIFGSPQTDDWVRFEGRLLPDGSRFADRIVSLSYSPDNQVAFRGKLETIGDTAWTVSSRIVQVNELTAIDAGLMVGDNVYVIAEMAQDGLVWAKRIGRADVPGSNFSFAGILTGIDKDIWDISGIKVTVDSETALNGDFMPGNPLTVQGVIKEDGTWLATIIDLVSPESYRFEFNGLVENINPWVVSGVGFDTTDWSEIDAGIQMGDQVRVSGLVTADGIWVAERIERLDMDNSTSFSLYGPVVSINPWNVRGVSLIVDERTSIQSDITLGEMVKVTGWILEDGTWFAEEIKHTGLHLGQGCFMISSVVESINGEEIILADGQILVRSEDLEVQGDLRENSLVRYQYCVDKDGVGTIGLIIVVDQVGEILPATGKSVICHYPGGNAANRHTIQVDQSAVATHIAHGDTLGECPSEKPDKKPKKDK